MESRGEEDVVRGDPALRRRALLVLPLVVALGVVALATAPRASRLLIAWLQQSPNPRGRAVLAMLAFAAPFTLAAWLVGVDAIRRSMQTLRARRFPPPGMRVVRDTPVLRGGRGPGWSPWSGSSWAPRCSRRARCCHCSPIASARSSATAAPAQFRVAL